MMLIRLQKCFLETGIKNSLQPFHRDKEGKFVAGTRAEAMKILSEYNWDV
jgi:uncharacterized membrane protein YukC